MDNDSALTKKRILVVDDDPAISESIKLALESFGYEVETASDGAVGLCKAERRRPDLMILDMMMPKRSGFLVLETLRQNDYFPTRIIMITANEGNRHKEYAESLGVDAYLRKPFEMSELLATMERVFNEK
ncbi:MAG: response regulator transcription factor [Planctomycetia bacterium]|nr:response regulator transcription factor [Planctomycetia bacterium]